VSGGYAADIGHTIPGFSEPHHPEVLRWLAGDTSADVTWALSRSRTFIGPETEGVISDTCAFTIEPQMLKQGGPMVSFHLIIVFDEGEKLIISRFKEVFDRFRMNRYVDEGRLA
jgi:hypothetical protein